MIDIFGQIERWREQLLDISKRNRLISCRIGGRGALRLDHPTLDVIWREMLSGSSMVFRWKSELIGDKEQDSNGDRQTRLLFDEIGEGRPQSQDEMQACLESPLLNPTDLLTEMTDKRLGGRLSRLSLNARTTLSEQGINSLFLAFGMLHWYESIDSDVAIRSPLLLVPVNLSRSGVDKPWTLSLYEEEVHANHCLDQIMKWSFDMELPEFQEDSFLDAGSSPTDYFKQVSDSIDDKSRWEIEGIAVLATFSFQKIAMWHDLGKNAEQVAGHGMCQSIAGAEVPDLTRDVELPSPREFDAKINPKDLHLILDADSSQLEALIAVKNGLNLVIDGPPGTGKSQTIANIIAECLASEKTVLFVSEKAAALEVVKHRLDSQRLGDFCLECHSHKANKKEVIAELGRCLALPQERYRDQTDDLDRLYETRQLLNAYVDALHEKRSQLNLSAFQVHGRLSEIHVDTVSRCDVPNVLDVDAATLRKITTALDRLSLCREVIANPDTHPWHGCLVESNSLTLEDDIRHHFLVLAQKCVELSQAVSPLVSAALCPEDPSKQDVSTAAAAVRQVLELPQLPSEWFERDPQIVATAFTELDELSVRYRSLLESTKPIREDHLEDAARILATMSETDSMTSRIRLGSAKLSLRKREHERLLQTLEEVREAVLTVNQKVTKVAELIHVTLSDPSLRLLLKLLTIGKLVARVGLAHESWFEPGTRKKLLQDADECIEQLALAERVKADFGGRLTRFAYEDEGHEVAERFTQFESFWARWFKGGWKQLREEAADFYHSDPPGKTAVWLSDMRSLRRFHRQRSQINRITEANADTLLREEDGTADWKNLVTILSALEAMQDEFKVPPSLRQALTTKGAIDREALEMVVVDLEIALTKLDGKLAALNEAYDISGVGKKHGYCDLSARTLLQWIDEATEAVTGRLNLMADFSRCLQDGQDISLGDEGVYRNVLKHTLDARREVDARIEQLGTLACFEGSPHDRDWHAEAELAKTYLWYAANSGTRDNPSFTTVLHDGSLRDLCETTINGVESVTDETFQNAWTFLSSVFDLSQSISTGIAISNASLSHLQEWLAARAEDVKLVHSWIEYSQIRTLLSSLQVRTVLSEVENSTVAVDDATNAFRARFYRLWLDRVYASDTTLSRFSVDEHEQLIGSFRELDVLTTDAAFKRIRSKLLNDPQRPHIGMVSAPSTSEVGLLLHEVNKKRRHKSLRRLFRDLPTLLIRLKPCVMMSPLAVSTYFESDDVKFDVVIFDEASQVRPFDAIGAIYRGRQLIVAGDQKQLPPTTFFDKLAEEESGDSDEEEMTENLADFESILDVCCMKGLPRKRLRWHYRSRREPLIGFSNHHFYDNELITFPSVDDVDGTGAVDFEHVEDGRWKAGSSGGYNLREAEHTARLIVEHFSRDPGKSLGVITFNQKQQLAVLDQLTLLRKNRPEFDKFFDEEKEESFFVKNLENVQGDERDVIFLSMGYGRDDNGKFAMRFGPLNRQGGERRLNVAVTRAKHHMKMIASIKSHDIDLNRTNSVGARLLKHYLEYAERGTEVLGTEITEVHGDDFDSPFEREVAEALRRQGFDTRTQVGCSGFRIDLAIVHPDEPGRYVLGVECDGATYHSSATARDRDRLRQSVLEDLGWQICRIWSTDWVRDPQRQIQRVRVEYETAIASPRKSDALRQYKSKVVDERPQTRKKQEFGDLYGRFGYYSDIREVDGKVIAEAIISILMTYGATQKEALLKSVSQTLGFSRLGPRIRAAIEDSLQQLTLSNVVASRDDDVFSLLADR